MKSEILELLYKEAVEAYNQDEIPVGAVIVKNGEIISSGHNTKQQTHIPTNHAEIIAINLACEKEKDWRLDNFELYVTLEPCKMCKEVIRQVRIKKVYYLLNSNFNNEDQKNIEYIKTEDNGNLTREYKELLQAYFKGKR